MKEQTAIGTFELDLVRSEKRLEKTQKETHTSNHDQDCQQATAWTNQRDIPKPRGGKGGHGEIKRIDVCPYLGIDIILSHKDRAGNEKDEDDQICRALNHILMGTKPRRIRPEIA
jgi:hypothetical protein